MISSTRPEVDFRYPYDEYLLLKVIRPLIGLLEVDLQSYFIVNKRNLNPKSPLIDAIFDDFVLILYFLLLLLLYIPSPYHEDDVLK